MWTRSHRRSRERWRVPSSAREDQRPKRAVDRPAARKCTSALEADTLSVCIMRSASMRMNIEQATVDDGPAVLQLLANSGLPVDGLLDHMHTAIVARDEGRVVG